MLCSNVPFKEVLDSFFSKFILTSLQTTTILFFVKLKLDSRNVGADQPSIIRCSLILAEAQDGLDKQEVNDDDDDDDDGDDDGDDDDDGDHIFNFSSYLCKWY